VRLVRLSRKFLGFSSNRFFNRALRRVLPLDDDILVYVRHIKTAEALLAKRASNWRIIFEAHELFYKTSSKGNRRVSKLFQKEDYVYSHCDAIVPISQTLRDDINTIFRPKVRQICLPTGTDVPEILPHKDFSSIDTIYYIGGLMPWKGIDTLIEAYGSVEGLPPMEIIGGANVERVKQLRKRINQMGLSHRVHLHDQLPHAEVCNLMQTQTKLCVFPNAPSSYERYTMPLKLFEYMAGGNIIVYSRIPSLAEVEQRGTIGVGVAPGDADALARALKRICADPQNYAPLANQAFELVHQYSWAHRASLFAEFAKDL